MRDYVSELAREIGMRELEDVLRMLQVLETVGAQIAKGARSRQGTPHEVGGRLRVGQGAQAGVQQVGVVEAVAVMSRIALEAERLVRSQKLGDIHSRPRSRS